MNHLDRRGICCPAGPNGGDLHVVVMEPAAGPVEQPLLGVADAVPVGVFGVLRQIPIGVEDRRHRRRQWKDDLPASRRVLPGRAGLDRSRAVGRRHREDRRGGEGEAGLGWLRGTCRPEDAALPPDDVALPGGLEEMEIGKEKRRRLDPLRNRCQPIQEDTGPEGGRATLADRRKMPARVYVAAGITLEGIGIGAGAESGHRCEAIHRCPDPPFPFRVVVDRRMMGRLGTQPGGLKSPGPHRPPADPLQRRDIVVGGGVIDDIRLPLLPEDGAEPAQAFSGGDEALVELRPRLPLGRRRSPPGDIGKPDRHAEALGKLIPHRRPDRAAIAPVGGRLWIIGHAPRAGRAVTGRHPLPRIGHGELLVIRVRGIRLPSDHKHLADADRLDARRQRRCPVGPIDPDVETEPPAGRHEEPADVEARLRPGGQLDARPHGFRDGRGPLDRHHPCHRSGAVDRHRDVHFDRHVGLPWGEVPSRRLTGLKADALDHLMGPRREDGQLAGGGGRSAKTDTERRAPCQTEHPNLRHDCPQSLTTHASGASRTP